MEPKSGESTQLNMGLGWAGLKTKISQYWQKINAAHKLIVF